MTNLGLKPEEGLSMFFIALLFLIVLGLCTLVVVGLNFGTLLSTKVYLHVFSLSLPGMPVLFLCLVGAFLGALVLYVFAARGARRDVLELKVLRAQVEDLEKMPAKAPGGGLSLSPGAGLPVPQGSGPPSSFAPPVVPMPGFAPGGPTGPGGGSGNQPGSGPPGPGPNPAGSLKQWQSPPNQLQNISPSASGNNLALPPRPFPPQQQPQPPQQPQPQQQMGGPRPPFPRP